MKGSSSAEVASVCFPVVVAIAGGAGAIGACGGRVEQAVADRDTPVAADREQGKVPARASASVEGPSTWAPDPESACPETQPLETDFCSRPQICRYPDTCSFRPPTVSPTRNYECLGTRWTRVSSRYPVTCPVSPPATGDPCEPSCGYEAPCSYVTDCGEATARCEPRSATWHRLGEVCGVTDAGTGG